MKPSNVSAVILCAGKGTRMNDNSKNKVCFDCAGKPVIRRIIENMQATGIRRFVLVVGHQAQSVMDSLADLPFKEGIAYAYQKEQRGTGDAVKVGLNALSSFGVKGRVIVSMGDKIIGTDVISKLIAESDKADVVWGVQKIADNPGGGRIIIKDKNPYGVVEFADVAYQTLAGTPQESWAAQLEALHINATKAKKIIKRAEKKAPAGYVKLNGRRFTAAELQQAQYANAGLYCFEMDAMLKALDSIGSDNAQGEFYLTDTLEYFARRRQATLFKIQKKESMLTFSTKPELRAMSRHFLRPASEYLRDIVSGKCDDELQSIYCSNFKEQLPRYRNLVSAFMEQYGDRLIVIARAPGRVNLMGRHIDHRGGNTNVIAVDCDTLMVASPRDDDTICLHNLDEQFTPETFSISKCLGMAKGDVEWLEYLETPAVKKALEEKRGHWSNYIKGAALRLQKAMDIPLYGLDVMVTGNIPLAAGLSSSSALVVATNEALVALNCLNLTDRQFVDLCGEGEWYVGSRGGANDHAAMKFGRRGKIVQLGFKPFTIGESYDFSGDYSVIVVNSMQQAKKSDGSRDTFNARVAAYEIGFMLMQSRFPQYGWRVFRELAEIQPLSDIYQMLLAIPQSITREQALKELPSQKKQLKRIFATHEDPGKYDLRNVLMYGVSECVRAKIFGEYLKENDYETIGKLMKVSHDGDRLTSKQYTDAVLKKLAEQKADVTFETGAYECSTKRIDDLCDMLNEQPGVIGSSIAGAGLGGSVIVLVKKEAVETILRLLDERFYRPLELPEGTAKAYSPTSGSSVLF